MTGKLILAPCGSGKTSWLATLPADDRRIWFDGDEILTKERIKNRSTFWYRLEYGNERRKIIDKFAEYLAKGYYILYSGNPCHMNPDLLIIPDLQERKNRLKGETGAFSEDRFTAEQEAYCHAAKRTRIVWGQIPPLAELLKYLE